MAKRDVHVIAKIGGGWSIQREGASRAVKTFPSQEAAVRSARNLASNDGTELIVHGRDGRIRESMTYGSDPNPPKDSPKSNRHQKGDRPKSSRTSATLSAWGKKR